MTEQLEHTTQVEETTQSEGQGLPPQELPPPAEAVQAPAERRKKKVKRARVPLTHRMGAKVIAFLLFILMVGLAVGSAAAAVLILEQEMYVIPEGEFLRNAYEILTGQDTINLLYFLKRGEEDQEIIDYLEYVNIAEVEIVFSGGEERTWGYDGGVTRGSREFSSRWYLLSDGRSTWYERATADWAYETGSGGEEIVSTVDVTIWLSNSFVHQDRYYAAWLVVTLCYALRYWVYAICAVSVILAVLSFLFLMCAAGRRAGSEGVQPGWGTAIPFDVTTAAAAAAGFLVIGCAIEVSWGLHDVAVVILLVLACAVALAVALGWCMSLAVRIKLGGWWRNTVVYYVLKVCWLLLCKIGRGLRAVGRGAAALVGGIPLVWKAALAYFLLTLAEMFALALGWWEPDNMFLIWLCARVVLFGVVMAIALMLHRLRQGGKALAAGDLSYQVDTGRLILDFKGHGEDLNQIAEGMTAAVEQRLRSERMKTELITNVSHDIKTPLTSIINYAGLIGQEPCENETIVEYAGVLHRQSERLKRLIEDLVEASKASTGSLEMQLAPCEVGVLLTQAAGEYGERLEEHGLTLLTSQPEEAVRIMADGRRLWRVFDNLMNNICKYALQGTRVYLSLEEKDGFARISFKNTSREALGQSTDDLMERFVRGDAARASDGSGLGLSIAKSLTELQKGTMELTVDGDLFKVILSFPVI